MDILSMLKLQMDLPLKFYQSKLFIFLKDQGDQRKKYSTKKAHLGIAKIENNYSFL